jgi:hypothetical protein
MSQVKKTANPTRDQILKNSLRMAAEFGSNVVSFPDVMSIVNRTENSTESNQSDTDDDMPPLMNQELINEAFTDSTVNDNRDNPYKSHIESMMYVDSDAAHSRLSNSFAGMLNTTPNIESNSESGVNGNVSYPSRSFLPNPIVIDFASLYPSIRPLYKFGSTPDIESTPDMESTPDTELNTESGVNRNISPPSESDPFAMNFAMDFASLYPSLMGLPYHQYRSTPSSISNSPPMPVVIRPSNPSISNPSPSNISQSHTANSNLSETIALQGFTHEQPVYHRVLASISVDKRKINNLYIKKKGLRDVVMGDYIELLKGGCPHELFKCPRSANGIRLSEINYYNRIPVHILECIARERDIRISMQIGDDLFALDKISPDWILNTPDDFDKRNNHDTWLNNSSFYKLIIYFAMDGMDFHVNMDMPDIMFVWYAFLSTYYTSHLDNDTTKNIISSMCKFVDERFNNDVRKYMCDLVFSSVLQKVGKIDQTKLLITKYSIKKDLFISRETVYEVKSYKEKLERVSNVVNSGHINIMMKIYCVKTGSHLFHKMCEKKHPFEDKVLQINSLKKMSDIMQFAEDIGMLFSENIIINNRPTINELKQSIMRNIHLYKCITLPVIHIDEYTSEIKYTINLPDSHLLWYLNNKTKFVSRTDTINLISHLSLEKRFFIPVDRLRCSTNTETIIGNLVNDPKIFIIAYGTINEYTCFELDELIGISSESEDGEVIFSHPNNFKKRFDIKEIETVIDILGMELLDNPGPIKIKIAETIDKLSGALEKYNEKTDYDRIILETLKKRGYEPFTINEALRQLFHIGMYMRRWKGPGNPFPHLVRETQSMEDPDKKVLEELYKLKCMTNQMSKLSNEFFYALRIVNYNANGFSQMTVTLSTLMNKVNDGEECIRQVSSRLIGTSIHYLMVLFRESIENVHKNGIDEIS